MQRTTYWREILKIIKKCALFDLLIVLLHRRIEFAQTNWKNLLSCDYRIVTCSYQPGHRMPAIYLEKHEIHAVIYQTAATNQTVMTMMMEN